MGQDKCRNTLMHGCIQAATPVTGRYIAIYHGIICNTAFSGYEQIIERSIYP
jgi:hypothetical protein